MVYVVLSLSSTTSCEIDILYLQAPNYPDPGRSWAIVDKYKVTLLYTAPTLVRSLMREGNEVTRIIFQLFNAINHKMIFGISTIA